MGNRQAFEEGREGFADAETTQIDAAKRWMEEQPDL